MRQRLISVSLHEEVLEFCHQTENVYRGESPWKSVNLTPRQWAGWCRQLILDRSEADVIQKEWNKWNPNPFIEQQSQA